MSVLIKDGRIVTAADSTVADVFVEGERISLIGSVLDVERRHGHRRDRQARAARLRSTRTRTSTCRSAARSRSTTSRPARPRPRSAARPATSTSASRAQGQSFAEALDDWHAKRDGKAIIDIRLPHRRHRPRRSGGTLEELATLPDQGITSYKLFMAYKGALHGRRRDALPDDAGRGRRPARS